VYGGGSSENRGDVKREVEKRRAPTYRGCGQKMRASFRKAESVKEKGVKRIIWKYREGDKTRFGRKLGSKVDASFLQIREGVLRKGDGRNESTVKTEDGASRGDV